MLWKVACLSTPHRAVDGREPISSSGIQDPHAAALIKSNCASETLYELSGNLIPAIIMRTRNKEGALLRFTCYSISFVDLECNPHMQTFPVDIRLNRN